MKHFILVKFKNKNDTELLFDEINDLFKQSLNFPGIHNIAIHKSNSELDNRYSLMIEMNLSPDGLKLFDSSEIHQQWKELYGDKLDCKAIFDCD